MSKDAGQYDIWDLQPADPNVFQRLEAEQLGSKRKFWFSLANQQQPWLFKYARKNTGEHWSEKIAAGLAPLLKLPAARVELARFGGEMGVACESFMPYVNDPETRQHIKQGELVHGNEVLAGWVTGYDKNKTFRQANHTWENIRKAIEARFPGQDAAPHLERLGGLIVFDALIGNVDRHHENWALLLVRRADRGEPDLSIAPSYDHASSLGRELTDARRLDLMQHGRVGHYVEHGHGGIYWDPGEKRAPCPMELLRRVAEQSPAIVKPWLDTLQTLDEDRLMHAIGRGPDQCMSAAQKDFCQTFLRYTMNQLRCIAP